MRYKAQRNTYAPVAQLVEQVPFKDKVVGSFPTGRTNSDEFKKRCIDLRKQDHTITEIMAITGRSKTSIYHHIRHIKLSLKRLEKYRAESGIRIKKFSIARKGKSKRAFKEFRVWKPELVLLLGHLVFDGEILRKRCIYNNRSIALIERIQKLMQQVYGYESKKWQNSVTQVYRISYHNVALSAYLHGKANELLKSISTESLESKRAFLQAFFDDEGCMDFRPKTRRRKIRGYQKDTRILALIKSLLKAFSIESRIEIPNEVVIVGKDNLRKFEKEINFSTGVLMNGNRANSRWKYNVEKRQLLRKAIETFKT